MSRHAFLMALSLVTMITVNAPLSAQTRERDYFPRPSQQIKTFVEFKILTPRIGTGLKAQEWGPVFEKLGASVTFRQQLLNEEPSVEETTRGTFRTVSVTGVMDAEGSLIFPETSFDMTQTKELGEWIDELKAYGAQGSPEGKPVWGLKKAQFTEIYEALTPAVTAEVKGHSLSDALSLLHLPDAYPVRMHSTAQDWLQQSAQDHPLRQDVNGMSAGTALAIVLADYGLGFRPLRTPGGGVDLVVEPLDRISDPWNVGWAIDPKQSRDEVAPKLFEFVTAGFAELPLQDVLSAVEAASETRIIIDYRGCAAKQIDPSEVKVSYPQKKTAWWLLIRDVTGQARLMREIRTDEAGNAFVYVYPFVPMQADY